MRMNSALGKRILALARDGDYAHAGEEEAIHLALAPIPKIPDQSLLDASCGRGGTAAWVQANGWGRVTGFDLEGESVEQARARHPDLEFAVCDVLDVANHVPRAFDVIYAFNAFYAFPDQPGALRALRAVTQPGARLALFDYVDRGGFSRTEFAQSEEAAHWQSLRLASFPALLAETGWAVESARDLDAEYARWYEALLRRFEAKREEITDLAGDENYQHAYRVYRLLLDAIQGGALGGAVVYAQAVPVAGASEATE
jgi:cyclopropane fatty-acyl-phospholipid synthase-like methyltransferase